jgi:DNA-binding MarR family transcriptional regulator
MTASPAYQSFLYKIATLRRLLDRYSSEDFTARSGLTLAEWRVLTVLYSSSPMTSRQVCDHLRADKAEISRACAGLAKQRYVSITKDTSDRRRAFVAITPRGKRLHDKLIPLRVALQRELEAAMTQKEVADFTRILDKLTLYVTRKIGAEEPRPVE